MNGMVKATGRGQDNFPPFIHLSVVWEQYGSCEIPNTRAKLGEKVVDGSPLKARMSFGNHLADTIGAAEVRLFDVHDFKPILGLVEHLLVGHGWRIPSNAVPEFWFRENGQPATTEWSIRTAVGGVLTP